MSNNLLAGKNGIIFGALNRDSIAWKIAEKAHAQGAKFVLTNAPIAMRMGEIKELTKADLAKLDYTLKTRNLNMPGAPGVNASLVDLYF